MQALSEKTRRLPFVNCVSGPSWILLSCQEAKLSQNYKENIVIFLLECQDM